MTTQTRQRRHVLGRRASWLTVGTVVVLLLSACGGGSTTQTPRSSPASVGSTITTSPTAASAADPTTAVAAPTASPTASAELCALLTPDLAATVVADIATAPSGGLPNACAYQNALTDTVSLTYYSVADLARVLNQPDLTVDSYFEQLIAKGNTNGVTTTAYNLGDQAAETRTTRETGRSVPGGFHSVTITWAEGESIYSIDSTTNVNESGANPGGSTIIPTSVEAIAKQISDRL